MKKQIQLFLTIFMVMCGSLGAMDQGPRSRIISSLEQNIHAPLLAELKKVKKGGKIRGTYYAFTDKKIAQALIDAHNRGAKVRVTLDYLAYNKTQAEALHKAGVPVRMFNSNKAMGSSHLHSKSTAIKHADGSTAVFLGSANASAQSHRNSEVVTITENDDEYYKKSEQFAITAWNRSHSYAYIKKGKKLPVITFDNVFAQQTKRTLQTTPKKMKMISSGLYDLTMSAFVQRIKNTDSETQKLDIVTYSFNDRTFVNAVRSFFKQGGKGRFVTEQGAVRDHKTFLDGIVDKGALVYLYDPTKRYKSGPSLQHAKILVRHDKKNPLVIVSENNPTKEARTDAGKAVLHPSDKNFVKTTTGIVNTLIQKYCDLYVPAAEPVKVKRKRKKGQDEFDVNTKELLRQMNSKDPREQMRALMIMKSLSTQLETQVTKNANTEFADLYKD